MHASVADRDRADLFETGGSSGHTRGRAPRL